MIYINSDIEGENDDLFTFFLFERSLIERLIQSIRNRMLSAPAEALPKIAEFLALLERLPGAIPEGNIQLKVINHAEENSPYMSVMFEEGKFWLLMSDSERDSVEDPNFDWATFPESQGMIGSYGSRDCSCGYFLAWIQLFEVATGDLEIEGRSNICFEEECTLTSDDHWARLAQD